MSCADASCRFLVILPAAASNYGRSYGFMGMEREQGWELSSIFVGTRVTREALQWDP